MELTHLFLQTYNEKIEERNEDILKLQKKITTTIHVCVDG